MNFFLLHPSIKNKCSILVYTRKTPLKFHVFLNRGDVKCDKFKKNWRESYFDWSKCILNAGKY